MKIKFKNVTNKFQKHCSIFYNIKSKSKSTIKVKIGKSQSELHKERQTHSKREENKDTHNKCMTTDKTPKTPFEPNSI